MRRAINIFYQCVVGGLTILITLAIYGISQRWHLRMVFADLSQGIADTNISSAKDDNQKAKAKEDLLEADRRILRIAQQKPFISIMSSEEAASLKRAQDDLVNK